MTVHAWPSSSPPSVLILHGYEGNRPGHWQTWLAAELSAEGVPVTYPMLPEPFIPDLAAWSDAVSSSLEAHHGQGLVVVCHSLACHLWAHLAAATDRMLADRAVLVAPPGLAETQSTFSRLPPGPINRANLERAAPRTDLVLGADDPWRADPLDFQGAGLSPVLIPGGAHLNIESGYGPWPGMLQWLLDPAGQAELA